MIYIHYQDDGPKGIAYGKPSGEIKELFLLLEETVQRLTMEFLGEAQDVLEDAMEAERKRQEELRTDKEKLLSFAQILHDIEWPDVKDDAAVQIVIYAKHMIKQIITIIQTDVESIS